MKNLNDDPVFSPETTYDIIIVGGGITGLTLACLFAQTTSLAIAVLEEKSQHLTWTNAHYHHRVSAISLASQHIFKAIHIWDELCKNRVSPFTQIEVWDASSQGKISFDSKEIAEPVLGYIIENNLIQTVLSTKLKHYPQVDFIAPVKLINMIKKENHIELMTENEQIFKGKLIVAADGANSWIRKEAGISLKKTSYQQEAIVTTVKTDLPHQTIARQVFLPKGPLAFLPLANEKQSSIVWSLPIPDAKRLMNLDDRHFQAELGNAFQYHLGEVVNVEKRYSFPLFKQYAKNYIKPHIALIGDAAHTVHPLAGQGVNMGMSDAMSLNDVIKDAIKEGRDGFSFASLRRYERWRKADNLALIIGIDMLNNLFASENKSIQLIRGAGLNAVNHMRWIKNIFTRHAVGE